MLKIITRLFAAGFLLAAACSGQAKFDGGWTLESSEGVTLPGGFVQHISQNGNSVNIQSEWAQASEMRFGLTLIGVIGPSLALNTGGSQDVNTSGPFRVTSRSHWDGSKLVSEWSTNEWQGTSFHGTWVRTISEDGKKQTLEIRGNSSKGQESKAVLVFRRVGL